MLLAPQARRFRARLKKTLARWHADDGNLLVSSLAYYSLFSVFPLLLLLIAAGGLVLSFSSGAQDSQQRLLDLLAQNTSAELAGHVARVLAEIQSSAIVSGPLGMAVLLFGAIGIFAQVDKAFDRIWNGNGRSGTSFLTAVRNALVHRSRAFLMLLALGFLVFAAFVASMVATTAARLAAELPGGGTGWSLVQILGATVLNWLLFSTIYKVLPKRRVRWYCAFRGGMLAAVLWEIARQVLALAVVGRHYTAYGIVGSMIALMVWIYVAVAVLFFGAEFARVISDELDEKSA